jgi:hypothetical protein
MVWNRIPSLFTSQFVLWSKKKTHGSSQNQHTLWVVIWIFLISTNFNFLKYFRINSSFELIKHTPRTDSPPEITGEEPIVWQKVIWIKAVIISLKNCPGNCWSKPVRCLWKHPTSFHKTLKAFEGCFWTYLRIWWVEKMFIFHGWSKWDKCTHQNHVKHHNLAST